MAEPIKARVAAVRSSNRRGGVAEALSLALDGPFGPLPSKPLVIPCLDPLGEATRSTHADTLSALVDVLIRQGANHVALAAQKPDRALVALPWYQSLGFDSELWERPVSFMSTRAGVLDEAQQNTWRATLPELFAHHEYRVLLTAARRPGIWGTGFGLAAMLNLFDLTVRTRLQSVATVGGILNRLRGQSTRSSVLADKLIAIARAFRPSLSVIDTFGRSRRSGPRAARRSRGWIIAGADPIAVDVIAATVFGITPKYHSMLKLAESAGLGIANLDRIEIVGDYSSRVSVGSSSIPAMHRPPRNKVSAASSSLNQPR